MHPRGPGRLLFLVLLLSAAAGLVLVLDPGARRGRASEQLQRLVGGLGFGPATDPSACAFSFDPRLCPGCPHHHGPVPAGGFFCPQHGCSVFHYPPLEDGPR